MRLVVDTNIILSAMIKDSTVRKIIVESGIDFFTPDFTFDEINRHLNYVCKKNSLNRKINMKILNILSKYINVVDFGFYAHKITEAQKIIKKIDENDVPFIALALSFDNNMEKRGYS
ncbi:MAG: PIN domain-containing protein [Thermoplasmatales archaeon]|nr:PIN domain-containing protein [Thermoplasmatales archaeon]